MHFLTQQSYGPDTKKIEPHDPPLLYHLGSDPSEKYDIAKQHPEVVAEIKAAVREHQANLTTMPAQFDP